jgi:hypothetical protein
MGGRVPAALSAGMSVQDITPDFFRFWTASCGRPRIDQERLWHELYELPHRQHFAASEGRHGHSDRLAFALGCYSLDLDRIRQMRQVVYETIALAEPAVAQLFALDHLDVRWVLLIGMYWSDGWVADIEGHPIPYIALELLEAPVRAEILLPHEAAHVAHATVLGDEWQHLTTLADGLFLEGLATLASARLAPGYDEAAYLWAGKTDTPRGLSVYEWLAECEAQRPALNGQLRQHLGATDPAIYAPWFYGENERPELPQGYGYFAGYRSVRRLAEEHSQADLARWPAKRIRHEVARVL